MARIRLSDADQSSVGQSRINRSSTGKRTPRNGGRRQPGPYSRLFRNGALGGINGSSTEGRFLRDAEKQLTDHLGGNLTLPQRLFVARLARVMLRLELLDTKIASGEGSEFDIKVVGGLSSQFRLMLREIGLKSVPRAQRSLAEFEAEIIANRKGDAA
jgi:hypothetical protein